MVGFSCDRFVDPLSDDLKCGICLQVFDSAVITACGHTYCYGCLKQWLTLHGKECPYCRQSVATRTRSWSDANNNNVVLIGSDVVVNNRLINSIINKLKIKCDFECNGCPEVMPLESMSTHLKICRYNSCQTCGLWVGSSDGKHNCIDLLKDRYKRVELDNKSLIVRQKQLESNVNIFMNKSSLFVTKFNDLDKKYKCIQTDYKSLKTINKQLDSKLKKSMDKTLDLESKCKQTESFCKDFETKFNEMNAKYKEIDAKLNTELIILAAHNVCDDNEYVIIKSIEINSIGIKLIKTIRDNDQKDVENNIMIPFNQMVRLHLTSNEGYSRLKIFKSYNLDELIHVDNNTQINTNSNDIQRMNIKLNETMSELLAKRVINYCKQVNSDCECSYTING